MKLSLPWTHSLLESGRRALEALRWRGPLSFLLLTVREVLKPLVYWHIFYILENDLTPELPAVYAQKHFVVRLYRGETEIAGVGPQLAALGELPISEILLRAQRGDLVAVAYAGTEPVGYSWMSQSRRLPLAFDATWILHPNEAVLFGSFVGREWRGQGVHSWLDRALNTHARENGVVRTIGSMAVYNRQTLALAKHTRKRRMMIVALARVRGIGHTWAAALGSRFDSRFRLDGRLEETTAEACRQPESVASARKCSH